MKRLEPFPIASIPGDPYNPASQFTMDVTVQCAPGRNSRTTHACVPPPLFPKRHRGLSWLAALILLAAIPAHAALRFDMFAGYDSVVPQGSWMPATFEVFNDGPPFTAILEVWPGRNASPGQTRSMIVELPTGTTKRFILPVHNPVNSWNSEWNARLSDERGRERAVAQSPRLRIQNASIPLAGAVSRHPPTLPEPRNQNTDTQPRIARIQHLIFPDNPIALQGLDSLYVSSEKLLDLTVNQANAIMAWLHAGGHLIVSVEQLNHFTGPGEWLHRVLPAEVTGLGSAAAHTALQTWLTGRKRFDGRDYSFVGATRTGRNVAGNTNRNPWENLSSDAKFEETPMQTATLKLRDGKTLIGSDAQPLAVIARRGRGQITLLAFAPELEPFKSWKNAPEVWARMTDFPPALVDSPNANQVNQGRSIDGVFGAMVDSDQVRKLPVTWLLLLLLAYLAVIGPLDQYWLKKINRQMLTWITFPVYVAFFSALIYFIGYKLRAGDSEWNELHVIDVIPHAQDQGADLRGWTFGSIYSPANARYNVASEQPFATLRGENAGNYGGMNQESSRARVEQRGNTFHGVLDVPVWTSQLFISDWWGQQAAPMKVTVTPDEVIVENRLDTRLTTARLVVNNEVLELGDIPPRKTQSFKRGAARKMALNAFVSQHGANFVNALNSRGRSFGDNTFARLPDKPNATMAASFAEQMNSAGANYNNLSGPPGFDLSPLVQRGDAIFLAFAPDFSPVKPLNKFSPSRNHRNSLFRVSIEMTNPAF